MNKEILIGTYKNGNHKVLLFDDGTKIKETIDPKADHFEHDFPESFDFKITNRCDGGCQYCHENSTPTGDHADLKSLEFLKHLHPYTEVAIGGGNVLEHPDFEWLLRLFKEEKVIANATFNQKHFISNFNKIKQWSDEGLLHGIGVSLTDASNRLLDSISLIPNIVIHVINGVFTEDQFNIIKNNNISLLVLGYKDFRRGHNYFDTHTEQVQKNQLWLSNNLKEVAQGFNVIAFDALGIKQLPVRELAGDNWKDFYQGSDGKESGTMFIDGVTKKFSLNSTIKEEDRFNIYNINLIDNMYKIVCEN